jgi:hypothetical protein
MNKNRGELCSDIFNNPKLQDVIKKIHGASTIHQINSVPVNSLCAIDNKKIPLSTGGVQMIIYYKDKNLDHICIQKKYQQLCYYYFRLRNFPEYIQYELKRWLNKQPWYLPRSHTVNTILKTILSSNFPEKIHTELNETIDMINKY